jgi:hypothetical protein
MDTDSVRRRYSGQSGMDRLSLIGPLLGAALFVAVLPPLLVVRHACQAVNESIGQGSISGKTQSHKKPKRKPKKGGLNARGQR